MILLLKLLLAHMTGDFILQPNNWITERRNKKLRSSRLYLHILLHGLLVLILTWGTGFWPNALVIAGSHFLIDVIKMYSEKENKRSWFVIDQILHLAVIGTIWYFWKKPMLSIGSIFTLKLWILLTAFVAVTVPASVVIRVLISKWTPLTGDSENESLKNAGKYIGILERLFVLVFVISGHWEAVGFLIAAKSVFRFGDLRDSKDRKLTEYILIGTLMSFGMAIAVGIISVHLLNDCV